MPGAEAIRAEAYSKYVEHRIGEGDAADPPGSAVDCRVDGGFGPVSVRASPVFGAGYAPGRPMTRPAAVQVPRELGREPVRCGFEKTCALLVVLEGLLHIAGRSREPPGSRHRRSARRATNVVRML